VSVEANKAVVRRYLEGIFSGNVDILDELLSEGYVGTNGPNPPAQYKANFRGILRAFSDITMDLPVLIGEGDWVGAVVQVEGTHRGEWRGIPATGRRIAWTITAFRKVQDGIIVQGYAIWDWLGMAERLGATLTPPVTE
jgi:predicted ester cyclase